jgi:hypothetical protein
MQQVEREIFIGGCGRSGTTLVGAILGAHSDCICPPESHFKVSALRSCQRDDGTVDLDEALSFIRMHWRFKLWDLDVDPDEVLDGSYADLLTSLVEAYAQDRGIAGHVWVDHTPENINYASVLLKLFPEAKLIHIVRDGRAVANSILPLDWGPNTVIEAAAWWKAIVREGLALEAFLPPEQIVRVRYEDLVYAPEATVRRLCGELDLAYEPAMLAANGFRPPGYTASQHELIGHRPDPARATRWKETLSDRQVEIFETLAADLLEQLGYDLVYGAEAKPPTAWERAAANARELVRGDIVNGVRWLVRSYPLWLSWDFLRVLPDTWGSYQKAAGGDAVAQMPDGASDES